jgi:hypothetical protein
MTFYHLKNNRKINSRKKYLKSKGKCKEGAKANLTLFTPEGGSVFYKASILSKSKIGILGQNYWKSIRYNQSR